MSASLEVRDLSKQFVVRGRRVVALEGINLAVRAGEFVSIVGSSGCGKSTLLSILAGLEQPTAGEALIEGRPILGPGPDRGLVFQSYSLLPWRTVAQNVALGLELSGMDRRTMRDVVDYYLEVVGLTAWRDARPSQLSGGMRQRVAIARALAPDPEVLLLDEPFGALDAQTKASMHEFLRSVWQRTRTTIVMVTHDVEEAIYLSERVYVFSAHPGRVREEVHIPFAPERTPALRREPEFFDLRDRIQSLLAAEEAAA